MEKCQCSFAKSIVGDGCRYCQPQTYIDKIHDQIEEERKEVKDLVERLKGCVVLQEVHRRADKMGVEDNGDDFTVTISAEDYKSLTELLGEME